MHFVAAKNLRIGHHDQFRRGTKKAAGQRAKVDGRAGVWPVLRRDGDIAPYRWKRTGLSYLAKAILLPNFSKALPFALVIAEDVDGKALAQPAMKLAKKFPALRFGNLRVGRRRADRAK